MFGLEEAVVIREKRIGEWRRLMASVEEEESGKRRRRLFSWVFSFFFFNKGKIHRNRLN